MTNVLITKKNVFLDNCEFLKTGLGCTSLN